jgi:hypothetical protein
LEHAISFNEQMDTFEYIYSLTEAEEEQAIDDDSEDDDSEAAAAQA